MKIITAQGDLYTETFREITHHEKLGIITFSYGYVYEEDKGEGPIYIVQVPMTFYSKKGALEAFRRYLHARNSGEEVVNFKDLGCFWPIDVYATIIHHKALQLFNL